MRAKSTRPRSPRQARRSKSKTPALNPKPINYELSAAPSGRVFDRHRIEAHDSILASPTFGNDKYVDLPPTAPETNTPPPEQATPDPLPLPQRRKRPKRDRVDYVLKQLWPTGIPSRIKLSDDELMEAVAAEFKTRGWRLPSPRTISRAAGRV